MFGFSKSKESSVVPVSDLAKINEIMKGQPGLKRYVCVGVYIDGAGNKQLFAPKLTFSVFHGDKPLVENVDTTGYADIPVGQLPQVANGPTGFNTDARGKYSFYTAVDGKEVKIYTNGDNLAPEGAQAYKVVHGFLRDDSIDQFSSVGMSSRSYHEDMLTDKIDGGVLKLLD